MATTATATATATLTERRGPPPLPPEPVVVPTRDDFSGHGDIGLEMFKILTDGKSVGSAPHDLKEVCIDEESSSSGGSSGLGLVVELQRERRG